MEDVGPGDLTAQLIAEDTLAKASIISREAAVLCGRQWVDAVFRKLDKTVSINWFFNDGDKLEENARICELQGNARSLLTGERCALNFLQTLSATSTMTDLYVTAVSHTPCKILDTRKTIPGLRLAQKYAVSCGGGVNHRMGLYDAILIKENHISAAGSIKAAINHAKTLHPQAPLEVEVENLQQLEEALEAQAPRILLDNMDPEQLRQAVSSNKGRAELEASGGITLDNIATIAATGVNFISIGALTKNVKAIDFSMRFAP